VLYRAYAKVNLTLEVLRRREDGFHELASLVHTISLADDLRIEPANELLTRVEGLEIDPETNLVARAAQLIAATLGERRGAELSLVKRIPAAAGLAGGSSDAATTLVGLNALWGSALGEPALRDLAAQLGSDIPFFIRGGAALMRGRGDVLEAVPALVGQWLVIVVPPHSVEDKTRRLYGALQPVDFSPGEATALAADRLRQHLPLQEPDLPNAFTRAARDVFPGLAATWERTQQVGQRRFYLSGAGPALFAFAHDRADAQALTAAVATGQVLACPVRTVEHARASTGVATGSLIGYP
jgi:4-diphosphocytidyl-2-C-methyl-D-erythritol kinase